jgi:hypothetical protein
MKIIITYYLKLQTVISYYIVIVLKMYAFENLPTHLHQWRSQAKGMAAVLRSLTVVFLKITEAAIPTARVGSP